MFALKSSAPSLRPLTKSNLQSITRKPLARSTVLLRYQSTSTVSSSSKPAAKLNELAKVIRDSIKSTGPIPASRYMQFCLSHPVHGYYSKGDVFGQKGDFITSPEISQIFGELVAIWFLTRWMEVDSPTQVRIVELGPGRGTLMDDVLRTLFNFPGIAASINSVHLVENSEAMREVQSQTLSPRIEGKDVKLNWYTSVEEIPETKDEFTLFVAHEFFDAMPINVFEKTDMGWREVLIDRDPSYSPDLPTSSSPSGLRFTLSSSPTTLSTILPSTSPRFANLPSGSRIEVSQDSYKIMHRLGQVINQGLGGCGLVVDYGADKAFASSFRAFRKHEIVDVFEDPGSCDLTANVDFAYLRESLTGIATSLGPISQAQFLLSLGIQPRLRKLLDTAPLDRREAIEKGAKRLIDVLGMGSQYQVMGVVSGEPEMKEGIYPFSVKKETVESKVLRP
ncbi:hypothetical protein I306_01204 [Cryptococcus gattii EJB2]|uniref:Protein arginine methyltransferase NDUFAF7 n=1 Tax=Cryptococcus gattii EJB2 TaxID=1296103 RepID=A0ABR5C2C2_9TREE|nr:hypothetical protein I306_01204 [Cryptococcus gattii EJB2]KJE04593.1 hypothetical protein I311_01737 [Cryptococcus gattii NT-10]